MQDEVFPSLGMNTSSYALYPSSGHFTNGSVIDGKRYRYPESAAAGLYTNVQDLCRLVRWLNRAWVPPGDIAGPLTRASVQTMLTTGPTPGIGHGFFLSNVGTNNFGYGHGGDNRGFKAEFKGYPNLGTGYAVMVNGDDGDLVGEISASIRSAYGWS